MSVLLVVAALGLGACGGDDEGSSGSGDTGAGATTGTTDTTATTGTQTRERTGKTTTSERKRDDKGGSSGNNGSGSGSSGGSDDSSDSGSSGGSKKKPSNTQLTDKNVKSTAKTVCESFLPTQLEKDLKSGKKSAEEIAKDYSQAFPAAQRKSAHDGCLAGLKTKDCAHGRPAGRTDPRQPGAEPRPASIPGLPDGDPRNPASKGTRGDS